MLILPAIDLRGGQCVRLTQGDYSREKVYDSDPIRVALEFEAQGAQYIHVVDLDGAKSGEPQNWTAIEGIAKAVGIPVEVGGGVRSLETARRLLDYGVARVVVGTKLVEDDVLAEILFTELDSQIVAGIDARDGKAAVAGWIQQSSISAVDLAIKMEALGARRIILTDIAQDGMLTGPNISLLLEVSRAVKIPIIQSGGIASLKDLKLLYDMEEGRPEGVIVGRAIYEGKFTVKQAVDLAESFATSERIF
jgi:phosphoribosylformimino-5-aminoimidazole carboxamide ribotide isomerase